MSGDRMIAPDGTDMGPTSSSGTVDINIRDGRDSSQLNIPSGQTSSYNDTFRTENLDRALGLAAKSAGDSSWMDSRGRLHVEMTGVGGGSSAASAESLPQPVDESFVRQMYQGMNKNLSDLVDNAQDQYVRKGAQSSGWAYGLNAAGYVASEFFPKSVDAAAFDAVGGPIVGRVVGWGSKAAVNTFPVLGREIGSLFGAGANGNAAAIAGRLAAESTNVSRESLTRALRQAGTPESLATAKLLSRGKLNVKLLAEDPSGRGLGGCIDLVQGKSKFTGTLFQTPFRLLAMLPMRLRILCKG